MSETVGSEAPGLLTVDLNALAANWRTLARMAAPAACAAVVKANAYGIGLDQAAPALWAAGARVFFVAHLGEGAALRGFLPEATIYILNGLDAGATPSDYSGYGLRPVIGSADELKRWAAFAIERDAPPPCALHLDTGMSRLGFESLAALAAAMEKHGATSGAKLLMSHFVSAELPADPVNAKQIALFAAARAAFSHLPASLANSSGMFLPSSPMYDLARPGYALYGGNPTPDQPNPMRTVVSLTVAIQQTRWIEQGQSCGYNAQWTAARRTRLATLPAGYADGLPRSSGATLGTKAAQVMIAGRRCPLVGRVSMDLTVADVTDLPEEAVRPGDRAEFFGEGVTLDDFAARSGTIGYQLLTGLGRRYRREYVR